MTESKEIVDQVISQVCQIVFDRSGIQLGEKQMPMVQNRLKSRMIRMGIKSFSEYVTHLKDHEEEESQALLSLITTHHTFFFREFSHFEFLLNKSLNGLIEEARRRPDKKIRIWSAASSRGQEVYSLAMFFNFHLTEQASDVGFEIWGTDVDSESIAYAQNAVYRNDELKQSPAMYIKDCWVRGSGNVQDFSKAKDVLKKHCHFDTLNLLQPESFLKDKMFDVIFCRNIFIYFDQDQIKSCTLKIIQHLHKNGFLFLGVSESLNGLGVPMKSVGPSVFEHSKAKATQSNLSAVKPKEADLQRPIEVLCVDDSPVILSLLKKILVPENGFVVKATAADGQQALDKIQKEKFDIITLDLHMPEVDGLGFLEKSKHLARPPVVIISSINSDDTSIAKKAIALGASDYVQKPTIANLTQSSNEIRSKLQMVLSRHKFERMKKIS